MVSKSGLYKHRIIPGHMGGTYEPNNIAFVTISQHALAHKQLYEVYNKYEDWLAWKALSGQISKKKLTTELELLRRRHISEGLRGRVVPEETRRKISASNKGKPKSAAHRVSLSKARKGKVPWNKGKPWPAAIRHKMSIAKLRKRPACN